MGDKIWKGLITLSLIVLAALALVLLRDYGKPTLAEPDEPHTVVVIDAGHGGEDGGASGPDGVAESGINLAVARRLDAVLRFCGCDTLMLRTEDISLHDPAADTLRAKKVSDLHNRASAVNAQTDPRLISIHQNHFERARYAGAQVFYGNGALSQPWAALTQRNLRDCLDPDNGRQAKPIPANVYLMNHVTCPALLVECGFLSNGEEAARLMDPAYQAQLALVIGLSYLQSRAAGTV